VIDLITDTLLLLCYFTHFSHNTIPLFIEMNDYEFKFTIEISQSNHFVFY